MMERTETGTLLGRDVLLREVSIGVALEANKQGDGFRSALFVLVHSAHWADSGERVFASVDSVLNEWPMIAMRDINTLAGLSGKLNMGDVTPATTNGTGETPSPSP